MKKVLLSIPVIAVAAWVGASYYAGDKAESVYQEALSQLSDGNLFVLSNEQYTAGFNKSVATTVVKTTAAYGGEDWFRLQHEIDHSPIAIGDDGLRFGVGRVRTTVLQDEDTTDYVKTLLEGFGTEEPLLVLSDFKFDGSSSNQIRVGKYNTKTDETEVSFAGLDYSINVDGNAFSGSGESGEFSVLSANLSYVLSKGALEMDLVKIAGSLYTGTSSMLFDELSISSPEIPPVKLESLAWNFDGKVEDSILDNSAEIVIGKIDSPFPVNNGSLKMTIDGTSVQSWKDFYEKYAVINDLEPGSVMAPEDALALAQAYMSLLEPLASAVVALELTNEGGKADVDLNISVVEESSPHYPVGGFTVENKLGDILRALTAKFSINADAEAINITPLAAFIHSPMAQQYVVSDGQSYKVNVDIADLIVNINGNEMFVEQMFPNELSMPIKSFLGQ